MQRKLLFALEGLSQLPPGDTLSASPCSGHSLTSSSALATCQSLSLQKTPRRPLCQGKATEGNRTLAAPGPGPGRAHEALQQRWGWWGRGDPPRSPGASEPTASDEVLTLPVPALCSVTRDDGTSRLGVCECRVTRAQTRAVVSTAVRCTRGASLGWRGATGRLLSRGREQGRGGPRWPPVRT